MLIDLQSAVKERNLNLKGVIHVGAHWGGEYESYRNLGLSHMVFFEPIKSSFEKLGSRVPTSDNVKLVNKALGNANKLIEMYVETTNKGQSNSILKPTRHLSDYPQIQFKEKEMVEMVRLDDFMPCSHKFNLLNMDVQGYELEVLKGAKNHLANFDAIVSEINSDELYENGVLVSQLDEFLRGFDFKRVETKWWKKSCWGDALYISNRLLDGYER